MSEHQYVPRNRETAQYAKRGRHWCMNCDRGLVGKFGKCPTCGCKAHPKKIRTPFVDRPRRATPAAILLQREIEATDDAWVRGPSYVDAFHETMIARGLPAIVNRAMAIMNEDLSL